MSGLWTRRSRRTNTGPKADLAPDSSSGPSAAGPSSQAGPLESSSATDSTSCPGGRDGRSERAAKAGSADRDAPCPLSSLSPPAGAVGGATPSAVPATPLTPDRAEVRIDPSSVGHHGGRALVPAIDTTTCDRAEGALRPSAGVCRCGHLATEHVDRRGRRECTVCTCNGEDIPITGPGARAPERPNDEGAGHRPTVAAAAPPSTPPGPAAVAIPGPAPVTTASASAEGAGPGGHGGSVATVLRERFWNLKRSRIRTNPPSPSSRASSIGEECERRLYYERTVPAEMRIAHEPALQAIFDLGNEVERYVLRELEDMGVEIVQRGRDHADTALQFSGHVDASIRIPEWRESIPTEIKGLNPFTAGTIETERDIREHPQTWVRKYYWQLQAYLRFERRPLGMFVLMDKTAGAFNFVPCVRDDRAIAEIEAKAARIRDAVARSEPLERRPGKDCERCPFLHVCAPDREMGPGVSVIDDPELEGALKRRAELEAAHREFTAIDKTVKAALKARPVEQALVGDFVVRGKQVTREGYVVKPSAYWQFEIEKLRENRP